MPLKEIVQMTKDGLTPDEVIRRVEQSNTIYELYTRDVLGLHEDGVDHQVIDHLLEAQRRAMRSYYQRRSHLYWHDPFFQPYPLWHCPPWY